MRRVRRVALLIFLSVAAVTLGTAFSQASERLSLLNHQISRLHLAGRYAEATPLAEKAIKLALTQNGSSSVASAAALNEYGELLRLQLRYAEAKRAFTRALTSADRSRK